MKLNTKHLFGGTAIAAALASCSQPLPVPARAMDAPSDVIVAEFCSLVCNTAGVLDTRVVSVETCRDPEDACQGEGIPVLAREHRYGVIANEGNAQIHRLDLDLARPEFIDADQAIPGATGILVAAGPIALANHDLPGLVWVASRGNVDDSPNRTASPQLTIVDVAHAENLVPAGLALPSAPVTIAPLLGQGSVAYISAQDRSLVVVADHRSTGEGLVLIQEIALGAVPAELATDVAGNAYITYVDRAHVDVFDLARTDCAVNDCLTTTYTAADDAILGPIAVAEAIADAPALMLVVDHASNSVLVYDLAAEELIEVNGLTGMRDAAGLTTRSRLITELAVRNAESISTIDLIGTSEITVTRTTRTATIATTSGTGFSFSLDYALQLAHDQEPFYQGYFPQFRVADGISSSAKVGIIDCSMPAPYQGLLSRGWQCTDPNLPSLRPVNCDGIGELASPSYLQDDGNGFVGFCDDPSVALSCVDTTDPTSPAPIGGCCTAGLCSEVSSETCSAGDGIFSAGGCDASWCNETSFLTDGVCCIDETCENGVSENICRYRGGTHCAALSDGATTCDVSYGPPSCEAKLNISTLEMVYEPIDYNIATDNWFLTWEGMLPNTDRRDGTISESGGVTQIQFGNAGACIDSAAACTTASQLGCPVLDDLCTTTADVCSDTYDLCVVCPAFCERRSLCELGVEASTDNAGDLLIVERIRASDATGDCAPFSRSALGPADDGYVSLEYPVLSVTPSSVVLGEPVTPGTPSLSALTSCFQTTVTGTDSTLVPALRTNFVAGNSWIFRGARFGYESPYIEENGACVVDEDRFAQDARPIEGIPFFSRWGFHFTIDPAVDFGDELALRVRGFEILFRTESRFGARAFTAASSPSGLAYAETTRGPRLVVVDNGSNLALIYNALNFAAVSDPIP